MIDWLKMRKQNRNLKRELRLADGQIETLNEQISAMKKEALAKQDKIDDMGRSLQKERTLVRKLRKEVRDQAAADLLVNALRALGVVPAPNNHTDYHIEAARLQSNFDRQQSALGKQQAANRLAGLGGAPGLFS